jgi:hypothetical protein
MLHMFSMVFKCFSGVFASASDVYFKCFICLICMLQLLHLDISNVDQELSMGCMWEAAGGVGDVRDSAGPLLGRSPEARHAEVLVRLLSGYRTTLALQIRCPDASKSL